MKKVLEESFGSESKKGIFLFDDIYYMGLVIINAEMIISYQGAQTTCSLASPILRSSFIRNIDRYLPPDRRAPSHTSAFRCLSTLCPHLLSTDCGTLHIRIEAHTTFHLNSNSSIFLGNEIFCKNRPLLNFYYF